MATSDARIDAYIHKAKPFAQPILKHLRALVHETCQEVEETMKWSFPHFCYRGEILCSMASFKQHAVFGFWKASLMKDPVLMTNAQSESAMGHLGKITSLQDLPADRQLKRWIQEAMRLNEKGIKVPKPKAIARPEPSIPEDFLAALKQNPNAHAVFNAWAPSHRREYIEWITEAKREETRSKRIIQAVEWIASGRGRNWQYESK